MGEVSGNSRKMAANGTVTGHEWRYSEGIQNLQGKFALQDLSQNPNGTLDLEADRCPPVWLPFRRSRQMHR